MGTEAYGDALDSALRRIEQLTKERGMTMTNHQALVLHVRLAYQHALNSEEGADGVGLVPGALAGLQEALRWAEEHGVREAGQIEREACRSLPGGGFFNEFTLDRIVDLLEDKIEVLCRSHGIMVEVNELSAAVGGPELTISVASDW